MFVKTADLLTPKELAEHCEDLEAENARLREALKELLDAHLYVADQLGMTEYTSGKLQNAHDKAIAALKETENAE